MEQNKEKKPFDLRGESKEFAIKIIKLYQHLTEYAQKKEYNLSKLLLVAGTRIGEYVRQESPLDAYHVANSAHYWLELLLEGEYVTAQDVSELLERSDRLTRYLYVISHPESRQKGNAEQAQ